MNRPTVWSTAVLLAKRDLHLRFAGASLGFGWNFLKPLLMILVYTTVFAGITFPDQTGLRGAAHYGIYLASGLLPWLAFNHTLSRITVGFVSHGRILLHRQIPMIAVPISVVISETFVLLITYPLFLAIAVGLGQDPELAWCALPLIIVLQQVLALSVGVGLASLHVFVRDVGAVLDFLLRLWFWMTPIAYAAKLLGKHGDTVNALNPYAYVVEAFRSLALEGTWPARSLWVVALCCLPTAAISWLIYRKARPDIPDVLA